MSVRQCSAARRLSHTTSSYRSVVLTQSMVLSTQSMVLSTYREDGCLLVTAPSVRCGDGSSAHPVGDRDCV